MIRNTTDKEKALHLFVKSLKEKHGDKIKKLARGEDKELGCGCADNNQLRFLKCKDTCRR